jgi:hypothetical protein
VLNRPVADQTTPPSTVVTLQTHLEAYLRASTEILLD